MSKIKKALTIVIGAPYCESRFVVRKYVFKLRKVDSKVVANALKATMELPDLSERHVHKWTVSFHLSSPASRLDGFYLCEEISHFAEFY